MAAPNLAPFFELLARRRFGAAHVETWIDEIGEDAIDVLRREGLLVPGATTKSYPCGAGMLGCARRVFPAHPGEPGPLVAVCGAEELGCRNSAICEKDLETLQIDERALVRILRRVYRITGALDPAGGFDSTQKIGEVDWCGERRIALLSLASWMPGFDSFLSLLDARCPHVVFVPRTCGVANDVLIRHARGRRVELVALDDSLRIDGRTLVAKRRDEPLLIHGQGGPDRARSVYAEKALPYCVQDHAGKRPASIVHYDALVAQAGDFDLLLDLVTPVGRGYSAHVRDERGRSTQVRLTKIEALALADLMTEPRARRPKQIPTFAEAAVGHPEKLFEKARRRVDRESAAGGWRLFQTVAHATSADKEYVFRPANGVTYALVRPNDAHEPLGS